MESQYRDLLERAYTAFNARDIGTVLTLMHPEVHWPNGWEGGYVEGHDAVRDYWKRQWKELDPNVQPTSFTESEGSEVEVLVHQTVKDHSGTLLFDGSVKHVYTFRDDLILRMEIKNVDG